VASPQVENGYIRIANELFRAAVRMLPAGKLKVFCAVCDATYGWGKKKAKVSYEELAAATGLTRRYVIGVVLEMLDEQVLNVETVSGNGRRACNQLSVQKDYKRWLIGDLQSTSDLQSTNRKSRKLSSIGALQSTSDLQSTRNGALQSTSRAPIQIQPKDMKDTPPLPPPPPVEGVRKGSKPESKVESGKSKVESGKSKVETPKGCSWCRTTRADDTTVVQDLMRLYHDRFKGTLGRCPVAFEARAGKVLATLLKRVDGREIGIAISHLFRSTDVWIVEHAYPVTKLLTDFDVLRERPLGATPNARRTGIRI